MNNHNGFKRINLALQGGGSHGAFTWGVLDRLLAEDNLKIEGISGTSAGAMNGAIMMSGFSNGGRDGARKALDDFWAEMGSYAAVSLVQRSPIDQITNNWNTDQSPGVAVVEAMFTLVSPYQLNPFNFHPLRPILEKQVDFKALQNCPELKLFVAATNVRTGRNRIFMHHELTVDALLASACLPTLFQAVEIDGDPYWDGGYTGNPAIYPLIYNCRSADVAVVQINPLERPGTPKTAAEIMNRLNEVTFNASLIAEVRAIAFVQHLIDEDHLKGQAVDRLKKVHLHMIGCQEDMRALGTSSKYNVDPQFLQHLKELGQRCAESWLTDHWDKIGHESSVDISRLLSGEQV